MFSVQFRSHPDSDFDLESKTLWTSPGSDLLEHSVAYDAFVDMSQSQRCTFPIPTNTLDLKDNFWKTIKWQHTVLTEIDFVDEWTAQDIAFHLAVEVNDSYPPLDPPDMSVTRFVPRRSNLKPKADRVTFDENVQLFIGLDEDQTFFAITVPHQSLTMSNKPWSVVSHEVSGESLAKPVDPGEVSSIRALRKARCPCTKVDPCFVQSLTQSPPVDPSPVTGPCEDQVDASSVDLFDPGSFCPPSLVEVDLSLPVPPPRHSHCPSRVEVYQILGLCTKTANPVTQDSQSQSQDLLLLHASPHEVAHEKATDTKYGQPQHFQRTLQAGNRPTFCPEPIAIATDFRPVQSGIRSGHHRELGPAKLIRQCRLEHESPITDLVAQLPADQLPADPGPHQQGHQPPLPPAFVADLSNRFTRMGFDIHDGDFEVPLRTWYIDHAAIRRWTAPRNLQLVGPPRGWEAQISSIWVDQINPDDWFDVTIIHPDPPRPPRHSFIMMDVVVTQSIQLDRYAGLITVFPSSSASFDMFSVAASFETDVSGFDIAQAADAATLCSYQECTVTFGWQVIPYTLRPQHVMSHGDGFQLHIHSAPAQLARQSNSQAGSSTDTHPSRTTQHASNAATDDVQSQTTPPASQFTTPLHIYQMDGMDTVVQLVNAQLAQPSHTIADALRVPFNCIEALHIMPIAPDAFPELAIPAIVQRVGDIPLHSTDRLIMIDVIYHHHPTATGSTNQPTVVRGVHRVTHHVSRRQILFKAAVFHYCEYLQEGCGVSLDGLLWPITQTDPRPVSHGSYATVDVPPPYGHEVDTQVAANTLHHDGTTDAMMDFLLDPMDLAEDTTFLTQLFASKMVRSLPRSPSTASDGVPRISHCPKISSSVMRVRMTPLITPGHLVIW